MKIIPTRSAVRNRQSLRPSSIWSVPKSETAGLGYEYTAEGNGGARVYRGRVVLNMSPKFMLPSSSSFFTAGSCFAREIETALHRSGQRVTSWNPDMLLSNELFHRYNTFSIINDFEFAAGRPYNEKNIVPAGADSFTDFTGYGTWTTVEEALRVRKKVIDVYRSAFRSDVIIITFGLVEAWYDRETETYLNTSPYPLFAKYADRFELRITSYQDNYWAAANLIRYLNSVNPDLKVIATVSPVPFSDTFSGQDVITANTYSKAVLRAVAQDLTAEFDFVDYFPSYEMVMLSDPSLAWLPDRRHVRPEMVSHIMSQFLSNYVQAEESSKESGVVEIEVAT